jgi:methionyl-tRNA formyltransferase
MTHARKLTVQDVTIADWKDWSPLGLERMHRAIGTKLPLRTLFRGKWMQLTSIRLPIHPPSHAAPPGTLFVDEQLNVFVACRDQQWIQLIRVKVEGKKDIAVEDWLNGYSITLEERLGHCQEI